MSARPADARHVVPPPRRVELERLAAGLSADGFAVREA
jgi:hypothetical protein